ncbi:hypothetical protein FB567DRAFT_538631 [Paraphoma chrysanthemicola]|uniref:Uncharacterized protein n=1 Tax=Paraphoma chrysanthemicola TaxID=798071 RepID=A0A8K0VTG4_9PLEO|nr:hypothetical protein FB567DRAFT_538631 [Paraphoma chrysanthemicola]
MEKKLDAAEELKLRQLEPVLQMWRTDFDLSLSAPPGLEPIDKGSKWRYQSSQCPACMLARIGSDQDVLFALFAGMIGRFPMYKLTTRKVILAEFGVSNLKDVKSKRVRFVRYWIQASRGGDALLLEAANLGMNLKKLYKEWKEIQGSESASLYRGRHSHDNSTTRGNVEESRPLLATRPRISTRTTTHARSDSVLSVPIILDPKIGPEPRPKEYVSYSPLEPLGFDMTGYHPRISNESLRSSTIFPGDSVSVAPLRINKAKQPERTRSQVPPLPRQGLYDAPVKSFSPHRRHDSSFDVPEPRAERWSKPSNPPSTEWRPYASQAPPSTTSTSPSTETSKSYHSSPFSDRASTATSYSRVHTPPLLPPRNPFRDHSASKHIPVPKRQSMYFGYDTGDVGHDPFEDVDEPLPEDEGGGVGEGDEHEVCVVGEDGRVSDADTHWSDLY